MTEERSNHARLTRGPVGRQLVLLTLPMVWGLSALICFNVVDTYFVGHLGTLDLAAISFTFPVVWIMVAIAVGIGIGASSTISRAIGSGNEHRVRRLTTDSLLLSLIIVAALVVAGILTIDPVFRLIGADDKTLPGIRDYMTIWYLGMIFVVLPIVGNNAIRAAGNTLFPAIVMTVSGVVNAVLDPLLIFGIGFFPRMELKGAALATVLGRAISMIASLWILKYRMQMITFTRARLSEILDSAKSILEIAIPAVGTQLIVPVSMMIVTRLVAVFGPEAVAGMGVATRIEGLAMIALWAVATVITPYVGQNFGARQFDRVDRSMTLSYRFCLVWGIFCALALGIFSMPLAKVFNPDPSVTLTASAYLVIVPISYGFLGMAFITGSSFNARSRPIWAAALVFTRMFLLYIPLGLIGRRFFGYRGIFAAACIANTVVGIMGYYWHEKTQLR